MEKTTGAKLKLWAAQSLKMTGRYLLARLLMSGISFAVCAVAFALIGVPLWGLLAFIVGVSNMVPYIGAWLAAIITGAVCFIMDGLMPSVPMEGLATAVWALLVILLLQILEEFVLEPLILGRAMDFKPLVVFAVVLAAGSLFGFWGIFFSMPIAAAVKLAYQIFYVKKEPPEGGNGTEEKP